MIKKEFNLVEVPLLRHGSLCLHSTSINGNNGERKHLQEGEWMGCRLASLVKDLSGLSKLVESVYNGCGVVVSNKNIRERVKILKKDYVEVRQLLSMNDCELDHDSGRVTVDTLAWEELLKVDGQNESSNPIPIRAPKRNVEEGTNKIQRRRTQSNYESFSVLSSIAE
ncbi:Uncharacterized protein Fot_33463 [Forsythia ovata]|uniref:Uncharacterized protein n=1 Tax=Forsythia ovata TaxID=205694 RepID=A0ABD1TAY3_9LAMI